MPAQYAREHENLWTDAADAFTSAAEVDAAMAHGWRQQHVGERGWMCEGFVDLGLVNDPTVIVLGHAEGSLIFIDLLWTLEGSRAKPVQLADVEAAIKQLSERFQVRRWRIESWQGVAAVQSLQRLGLPVELFAPTAKAHAEEWPILAQRLSSRTIILPKHERLREELLNLRVDLGPQGVRVIDKGRVHQDHAVAVRGVVAALATRRSSESIRWCLSVGEDDPNPLPQMPMASEGLRCL
jgi:LmbE family N-acetylglucosaminyl deacetylase